MAAKLVEYRGMADEYDTFIIIKAWKAKRVRIEFGEKISKESPIMAGRFNVNDDTSRNTTLVPLRRQPFAISRIHK